MIKISDHLRASLRSYLSIRHLSTAKIFLQKIQKIENNESINAPNELAKHQGYALSLIFLIVAFLESTINEIFSDCSENMNAYINSIHPSQGKLLGELWKLGIPRTAKYNILEKYQIALTVLNKSIFDRGKNPYQDVKILLRLRNALIHYEPESVVVYDSLETWLKKDEKFEKQLKNKFKINSLAKSNQVFFPDKILGYGCAKWAISSALNLTDEFYNKLDLRPKYQR